MGIANGWRNVVDCKQNSLQDVRNSDVWNRKVGADLKIHALMLSCALLAPLPGLAQSGSFLDAARDAYSAAWDVSPLRIDNAFFVTRPAEIAGDFVRRETNVFDEGEPLQIYAEPKAYSYIETEEGKEFGVILDLEVLSEEGESLLAQTGFQTIRLKSQIDVKELFLNITLNLSGFAPGGYQVQIRANDIASEEFAEFTLPFEVSG